MTSETYDLALSLARQLSDAELLQLHREVSRGAAEVRSRDPEYVLRQKIGYMAARQKMDAGRAARGAGS